MAAPDAARRGTSVLLALTLGAFLAGIVWIFLLRFEAGDVYPPYSSLRTDPLGAKAYFESLDLLPRMTVRRNFLPLAQAKSDPRAVYFFLGVQPESVYRSEPDEMDALDSLLREGARVVITFSPVNQGAVPAAKPPPNPAKDGAKKPEATPAPDIPRAVARHVSIAERWGVTLTHAKLKLDDDNIFQSASATRVGVESSPPVSWHSSLVFQPTDAAWRVQYERDSLPVVIERAFGRGSLVLCSDSFFASNEALRDEPHANLLAWLVGGQGTVVFDEMHLGVQESTGVASLSRRYGLQAFFFGLLVLAALFIWKNSTSLVPPLPTDVAPEAQIEGRDATAGLVNLLRRSIPPRHLLIACVEEWKKSFSHRQRGYTQKLPRIESAAATDETRPVEGYRAICQILSEK